MTVHPKNNKAWRKKTGNGKPWQPSRVWRSPPEGHATAGETEEIPYLLSFRDKEQ